MPNPWFRLYFEFAFDPKIQSMDETLQRRFIMLLCLQCSGDLEKLADDEIAFTLRIGTKDLEETKKIFIKKGFIDENWNVLNWEKRQYKSDSSTTRVRKYRENKKDETLQKRFSNNNVTPPDTDTDTDTDKEEPKTSSASVDAAQVFVTKKKRKLKGRQLEMFERFWTVFDHKKDKAQAADAWFDLHVTETLFSAIVLGAEATARERPDTIKAGRTPIYAQGWLSGRRWEDEIGDKKESASPEDYSRYLNAIRAQQ